MVSGGSVPGDDVPADDVPGDEIPGDGVAAADEAAPDEAASEEEAEPVASVSHASASNGSARVAEPEPEEDKPLAPVDMKWYVLKVQSNREKSIRDSLIRRVKRDGLERYFGEIVIPTEKRVETKGGKKRVYEQKLYPGYIMIHMELNDETWYLVRDTGGVGDFTGAAGKPLPMPAEEVAAMLKSKEEATTDEPARVKINFAPGDTVKIKEGPFENFEGAINSIDEASGKVSVMIQILGRSAPVDLEYWQVERV
jgi:transcriptional antiterminator NusG